MADKAKKHILIIDDERHITEIFGLKLKLAGFDVTTTTSGAEGIELIRNEKPDVVLLDILMPNVNGFDVLREVRKFSTVKIIVFTARPDEILKAIELGADDYVIKPVDLDQFVKKVENFFLNHNV